MFQTLRGMKDFLPEDAARLRRVEKILKEIFARYGYRELITPVMEDTALFARGLGSESEIVQKEMYTFKDLGGRSVTLRPEGTAPVLRALIQNGLLQGKTLSRIYYFGTMFRYEKPQKGRMREFRQYGIEAVGSDHPALDAEVIEMMCSALDSLDVKDYSVLLNSVGCAECRPLYVSALTEYAKPYIGKAMCKECGIRIERNALRMLDCKNAECAEVLEKSPKMIDFLCAPCKSHFDEVLKYLGILKTPYEINHHLVRGLDYYVRTAFEFVHKDLGAQDALLGGGRYDGLSKALGGEDAPGIGFAGGLERLLIACRKETKFAVDVYVIVVAKEFFDEGFKILKKLRRDGFSAEISYEERSAKAQMKEANKSGARFAVVIGEDEVKANILTLRDMTTGEQKTLPYEDCAVFCKSEITTKY